MDTAFGFSYYETEFLREKIYYRPGDPKVYDGGRDYRSADQKAADQIAGVEAEAKWRASQSQIAAFEQQRAQQERDEQKRVKDWRKLFHSKTEFENAPKFSFAIDGFLQEGGITMVGGPSGDGKTLIAMEMAKCLLEGSPLFGHFKVLTPSKRVIYLIPESGLSPLKLRTDLFGLTQYADDKFFSRSLDSKDPNLSITDPAILNACESADVFLDTAVRFMEGDENAAADSKRFADNLFALLRAGARTVTGLHHAPKAFERAQYMTLENILRGSGDIGAMLAACWGIAQVDHRDTTVYVHNVKARDFEPCGPFTIAGCRLSMKPGIL